MIRSEEDELLRRYGWSTDDVGRMSRDQFQAALHEALKQAEEERKAGKRAVQIVEPGVERKPEAKTPIFRNPPPTAVPTIKTLKWAAISACLAAVILVWGAIVRGTALRTSLVGTIWLPVRIRCH